MTDLTRELFDIGKLGVKRKYYFIDAHGRKGYAELDSGDRLSPIRCILDRSNLVIYNGHFDNDGECPACKECFEGSEELIIKYIENHFIPYTKSKIKELKERLNHLEGELNIAENRKKDIKETKPLK